MSSRCVKAVVWFLNRVVVEAAMAVVGAQLSPLFGGVMWMRMTVWSERCLSVETVSSNAVERWTSRSDKVRIQKMSVGGV